MKFLDNERNLKFALVFDMMLVVIAIIISYHNIVGLIMFFFMLWVLCALLFKLMYISPLRKRRRRDIE